MIACIARSPGGSLRMRSSSMKSQMVMQISASRSAQRTQASHPFQVKNPSVPMMIPYAKSRDACSRSSVFVP